MKLNTIVIFLISMFSFVNVTFAECSYNENVNLSSYASNIKIGYDYTQSGSLISYTIEIFNLIPELRIEINNSYNKEVIEFGYIRGNTNFIFNISDEEITHTFKIFANSSNCSNVLLRTINFVTPKFNKYSLRPECINNPDFDLCQKFNPKNITDEVFLNSFNNYINKTENNKDKKPIIVYETFNEFITNNLLIIGIILSSVLIAIILIIIAVKIKNKKRIGF